MSGFTPVNGVCSECTATNCLECLSNDAVTCSKCGDGYYLTDGSCKACPYPNCATCNATVCFTFKQSTGQIAFTNSTGGISPA